MEDLKVGSIVIATSECIIRVSKRQTLTIGRAYVITKYRHGNSFSVIDDKGDDHSFNASYFKRNKPVYVPLIEKVDAEKLDPDIRAWLEELIFEEPGDSKDIFSMMIIQLKLKGRS